MGLHGAAAAVAVDGCRVKAKSVGKTLLVNPRGIGMLPVVVIKLRLLRARAVDV